MRGSSLQERELLFFAQMNIAMRLILLSSAFLIVCGCSRPTGIAFHASFEVDSAIAEAVRVRQLPPDFTYLEIPDRHITYTVLVYVVDWTNRDGSARGGSIVKREWYAPVVSLSAPERDTGDFEANFEHRLEPVEEIGLPLRGISHLGLYPGDEEYPWYRDTIVSIVDSKTSILLSATEGVTDVSLALLEWQTGFLSDITPPEIVWVAGVGDIMPGRGVDRLLDTDGGLHRVFADTLPFLQSADILLGNLEGAITTRGTPMDKSYTFRYHPRVLVQLMDAGFDYLSLTNNHSFDYGQTGFTDTLDHFSKSGMVTSGAALDPAAASISATFLADDMELRVLSVGAYPTEKNGFNGKESAAVMEDRPGILWTGDSAFQAVSKEFSDKSFDILMIHGGEEWSIEPAPELQALYQKYVDLGADLIIGSHPHVLQGLQSYDGKLIAYSLGNFIFPGMEETRYGEESLILRLGVHENVIRYVELEPVQIDGRTLSIDHSGRILARVLRQTEKLNSSAGSVFETR